MGYVDIQSIHDPTTGTAPPAAWGDQIRENEEFLVAPPRARVWKSSNTVCAASTATPIQFTNVYDATTPALWVPANATRLTAPIAGQYAILANVTWPVVTGFVVFFARLNGITTLDEEQDNADTYGATCHLGFTYHLAAGDYVDFVLQPLNACTVVANNRSPMASMWWIGR